MFAIGFVMFCVGIVISRALVKYWKLKAFGDTLVLLGALLMLFSVGALLWRWLP